MSQTIPIKPTCLFFLIVFILSSCSIQKRRYSRGYAVDFSLFKAPFKDKTPSNEKAIAYKRTTKAYNNTTTVNHKTLPNIKSKISLDTTTKHPSSMKPVEELSKNNVKASPKKSSIKTNSYSKSENKMNSKPKNPKRNIAIIIGASLILMAVVAAIAAPIITGMFVFGNPALTALNVTTEFGKYTGAIIGWLVILVLDLLVSLGVYKYYKDEKRKMAITSSVFRFIYSAFLGGAIFQLLKVTASAPAFTIYNHMNAFTNIWNIGLIVFGLHLITLGILFNNEGGKKWINILIKTLLIAAGVGYIVVSAGILIAPNPVTYAALIQPVFLVPMILGEIFFAIWMLVKGGKKG